MSLAMYRSPYAASSTLQRSSTGAVKPSRTFASGSVGAGSSSSTYSGSRLAKQANSSSGRALPNGPGPLPDRPVLLKSGAVKYVTESTRDRTSTTFRHFNYQKSNVMDSPTTARRKISNDSGYGSSGGKDRTTLGNYRYGDLSKSKSKSMSHLSHRDEADEVRTTSYKSRTDSSSHGVSSKTYAQNHIGSTTTLNGSNSTYSSTGIYRSTTHSDYKDPGKDDKNSLGKTGHSYSTDKDLSNGYTAAGKHNYSVIDADKTHKATITALPGADMKCTRKSSFSSSNSSPSNSVSLQNMPPCM